MRNSNIEIPREPFYIYIASHVIVHAQVYLYNCVCVRINGYKHFENNRTESRPQNISRTAIVQWGVMMFPWDRASCSANSRHTHTHTGLCVGFILLLCVCAFCVLADEAAKTRIPSGVSLSFSFTAVWLAGMRLVREDEKIPMDCFIAWSEKNPEESNCVRRKSPLCLYIKTYDPGMRGFIENDKDKSGVCPNPIEIVNLFFCTCVLNCITFY